MSTICILDQAAAYTIDVALASCPEGWMTGPSVEQLLDEPLRRIGVTLEHLIKLGLVEEACDVLLSNGNTVFVVSRGKRAGRYFRLVLTAEAKALRANLSGLAAKVGAMLMGF